MRFSYKKLRFGKRTGQQKASNSRKVASWSPVLSSRRKSGEKTDLSDSSVDASAFSTVFRQQAEQAIHNMLCRFIFLSHMHINQTKADTIQWQLWKKESCCAVLCFWIHRLMFWTCFFSFYVKDKSCFFCVLSFSRERGQCRFALCWTAIAWTSSHAFAISSEQ